MQAVLLVGTICLVLLVNLVVSGVLLWLSCRICRIKKRQSPNEKNEPVSTSTTSGKPISFLRALGTAFLVPFVNLPLGLVLGLTMPKGTNLALIPILILEIVLSLVLVPALCIWLLLRPSLLKSLGVTSLWALLSVGYAVCFVLVAKTLLFEAFIIPTGGMAETLLGEHKTVVCEQCGHHCPVNFSSSPDPMKNRLDVIESSTCPNCRWECKFASKDQQADRGDRILVAKSMLNALGFNPNRWDEVVFRYPVKQQAENGIPLIYDKRLIGLGGETIAIHQGKLHLKSSQDGPRYDDSSVDRSDVWQKEFTHEDDPAVLDLFQKGKSFTLLRKAPKTILELMRLVYDNDKPAKDMKMFPRWTWRDANSPWNRSDRDGFRFSASTDHQEGYLSYRHLLRENPASPQLIADFLGYNSGVMSDFRAPPPGQNWVSDLILELDLMVQEPRGTFVMELAKGPDRFQASWDLSTGECSLDRVSGNKTENLARKPTRIREGTVKLRLANVDARLVVWVNDELPFGDGIAYEPIKELTPTKENDLEPARLGGRDATFEVNHLRLYRDTYYTCQGRTPDVTINDWTDPEQWNKLSELPIKTYYVQPGHYFVLGDNSSASSDSRSWGLVPSQLMMGKVVMIYYPWQRARLLK